MCRAVVKVLGVLPGGDRAEKVQRLNAVSLWGGYCCSPIPWRSGTAYCPVSTSGRSRPADLEPREGHRGCPGQVSALGQVQGISWELLQAGPFPRPALGFLLGKTGRGGRLAHCSQPVVLGHLVSSAHASNTGPPSFREGHAAVVQDKGMKLGEADAGGTTQPTKVDIRTGPSHRPELPHRAWDSGLHSRRAPQLGLQVRPSDPQHVGTGAALGGPQGCAPLPGGGALGFRLPPDLWRRELPPKWGWSAPGSLYPTPAPCSRP